MQNRLKESAKYHANRIAQSISGSDPKKHRYQIISDGDFQASKLMLALDIRRLAEILSIHDYWVEKYQDDYEAFKSVAHNDFLDILCRMIPHVGEFAIEYEPLLNYIKMFSGKRFKVKYGSDQGKSNDAIRAEVSSDIRFAILVTSKIIHADEFSVYDHASTSMFSIAPLVMAGQLMLDRFAASLLNDGG